MRSLSSYTAVTGPVLSPRAAKTQTLYTIKASYSGPADAKKGLVGHLAWWLAATSNLLAELFPESSNALVLLPPARADTGSRYGHSAGCACGLGIVQVPMAALREGKE